MARADVQSNDGNYTCWSLVGNFGFEYNNGQLTASSVHRFNARNDGDDTFGCAVRYEHKLEKWNGSWVPEADDSIGPQGGTFRLRGGSYYDNHKRRDDGGSNWDNVRETTTDASSGDRFRIKAYMNVQADPSDYENCKAEETSYEYTVP